MLAARFGLREGDILQGRYRLLQLIGKGGMGRVFVAEDLRLPGKRWAVKETAPLFGDTAGFLQEAALLARLQHALLPQIVDYYAPVEEGGCAYVVMEFVPGVTLEAIMDQRSSPLREESVVSIGIQLCEVFVYLHGQPEPIVFRDLKPGNIMIDSRGRIKLIDFGIARRYKPQQSADTVPLGTVGFAAPEQLRGEQTDPRSDLFSLGAVLYYLLSGGQYAAMSRKPLSEHRTDLSSSLLQMVAWMLEHEPDARPQRAEEALAALRRASGMTAPGAGAAQVHTGTSEAKAAQTPKLILVGGLYPGAGATFAAFALSHALDSAGVEHAVGEPPAAAADHYALLDGDRKAPSGYRSLNERMLLGERFADSEWTSGHALRVPSQPTGGVDGWTEEKVLEWLYRIARPIIIIDLGSGWKQSALSPLLAKANELIVAVDPSPAKLLRPETSALLRELEAKVLNGARLTWLANRDAKSPHRSDWLGMLPEAAVISLPAFDTAAMLKAQWNGSAIPIDKDHRKKIETAFSEWLAKKGLSKSNGLV